MGSSCGRFFARLMPSLNSAEKSVSGAVEKRLPLVENWGNMTKYCIYAPFLVWKEHFTTSNHLKSDVF